jgi:hypothetical protein
MDRHLTSSQETMMTCSDPAGDPAGCYDGVKYGVSGTVQYSVHSQSPLVEGPPAHLQVPNTVMLPKRLHN